jgi:hypothetical protein
MLRRTKIIQNLTAENAEVKMAKAQGPGFKGRNGPVSEASPKSNNPPRSFQERMSALSTVSSKTGERNVGKQSPI